LAVDSLINGWRGRGPAVDHGSQVHGGPAKGVHPDLICVVHRKSGGLGSMQAVCSGGAVAGGGTRWSRRRSSPELARKRATRLGLAGGLVLHEAKETTNLSRGLWRRLKQ
jgi:hypothetical protein